MCVWMGGVWAEVGVGGCASARLDQWWQEAGQTERSLLWPGTVSSERFRGEPYLTRGSQGLQKTWL